LSNHEEGVLVLQGGGALGAYQAGVFEALHNAEIEPDWVAGIFDRRDQLSTDRRQPAREARIAAGRVLAISQLGLAGAYMVQRWAGPLAAE
jgi:hypothetical protein